MSDLSAKIATLSAWIDASYPPEIIGTELHVRRRTDKLAEETGEVVEAVGGFYAENPRKGRTHTQEDILKELLDVMTTAAGAYESITGNRGRVIDALDRHLDGLLFRVGLTPEGVQ